MINRRTLLAGLFGLPTMGVAIKPKKQSITERNLKEPKISYNFCYEGSVQWVIPSEPPKATVEVCIDDTTVTWECIGMTPDEFHKFKGKRLFVHLYKNSITFVNNFLGETYYHKDITFIRMYKNIDNVVNFELTKGQKRTFRPIHISGCGTTYTSLSS